MSDFVTKLIQWEYSSNNFAGILMALDEDNVDYYPYADLQGGG